MRRRLPTTAALAFAVLALVGLRPSAALAQALSVAIDQAARLALPAGTQNVMIGNPAIADINVLDSRNAVLLGRSYGVTNLIVVDGRGRTLMDRPVVVSAPDLARVTAWHGPRSGERAGVHVENYACTPRCERVPMPGEGQNDYQNYSVGYADADRRNSDARKNGPNSKTDP